MSTVQGGEIDLDLNTIGVVYLLRPFGVKANIICQQIGGEQGNVKVTTLDVSMSSLMFGTECTAPPPLTGVWPLDNNVVYLGDAAVKSNTPWKIVSDCPLGWNGDMTWNTDVLHFKPADGVGMLPLHPNPNSPGNFRCEYSFVFYLMVLSLSHPVPYPIAQPPFMRTWPDTIINQTTISRGVLDQNSYELNGQHGTQTIISPTP